MAVINNSYEPTGDIISISCNGFWIFYATVADFAYSENVRGDKAKGDKAKGE